MYFSFTFGPSGVVQFSSWQSAVSGGVLVAAAATGHSPASSEPLTDLVGAPQ